MGLVRFQPVYVERVWGGRELEKTFGRRLPAGVPVGESWDVVDRPEAQSVITGGPTDGMTLRSALERCADVLMGPSFGAGDPFPILVKWLDCSQRLSLQVHPRAAEAARLGGEPKTENWYVAKATDEAAVFVGMKDPVTRQRFEAALADGEVESLVRRVRVRAGDSIFVPSGRVHAIDAGNLILEVQENSDTTYRLYDWDRLGLNGRPRELHLEEGLASAAFDDTAPSVRGIGEGETEIANCEQFRIRRYRLEPGDLLPGKDTNSAPWLIHVVSGSLRDRESGIRLGKGDNALAPYRDSMVGEAMEKSTVLITDRFSGRIRE